MSIDTPFVRHTRPLWALFLSLLIFGCGRAESNQPPVPDGGSAQAEGESSSGANKHVVMFLGTSLTDGYGLEREDAYPARIQEKVDSAGLDWEVVNAGLSGEKSAAALQRVRSWLIRQPFDVLVVETGANDMLQGANVDTMRANIQSIIDTVQAARPDARIVLVGMMAAPNLGPRYVERFNAVFPALARENRLTFIPFLLDGVAGQSRLNLADGIHPNEDGHRVIAAHVWQTLEPLMRNPGAAPAASP
ncbi:arylesterase [Longimicrobium sp.]|uniref:arylesterase n=1 Tax=Longimicrobium sp. TaxID=2029185 RepID=UPI002E333F1F|nr:arylesterase [Longimicrobium sp.]HEX6038800.1 arylesterase [Longimicrobium sp.]